MLVLTPEQHSRLALVARRWDVQAFELFGSAVGDTFGLKSDVDVLVEFRPGVRRTLFDMIELEEELEGIVAQPVDLVTRRSIEWSPNPIRRKAILDSAQPLYRVAA